MINFGANFDGSYVSLSHKMALQIVGELLGKAELLEFTSKIAAVAKLKAENKTKVLAIIFDGF